MKTFWIVFIVCYCLFCGVLLIKNNVTYHNLRKIGDAILRYNLHLIDRCETSEELDAISFISYNSVKSYGQALWNLFDWGYEHLVAPDIFEKIQPFIKED